MAEPNELGAGQEYCKCGRVVLDRFIGTYATMTMNHTRDQCMGTPLVCALPECVTARARIAKLEAALDSACGMNNGKAVFITANGIPMEMPAKTERIVRAALEDK